MNTQHAQPSAAVALSSLQAETLCASDWMRGFACGLARQHPALSPEQAVSIAVRAFETLRAYEPEQAAALCAMGLAFNAGGFSAGRTAPGRPAPAPSSH